MVLAVWPTFWTVGGMAAIVVLLDMDWGERAFGLLWLCGWAR